MGIDYRFWFISSSFNRIVHIVFFAGAYPFDNILEVTMNRYLLVFSLAAVLIAGYNRSEVHAI